MSIHITKPLKQHQKGSQYGGYLFDTNRKSVLICKEKVTNMVGTFLNEDSDGFQIIKVMTKANG